MQKRQISITISNLKKHEIPNEQRPHTFIHVLSSDYTVVTVLVLHVRVSCQCQKCQVIIIIGLLATVCTV